MANSAVTPTAFYTTLGRTDGGAVPAGYIGEKISGTMSSPSLTAGVAANFGSMTLNKGVYIIFTHVYLGFGVATSLKRAWVGSNTTSATADTSTFSDFANPNGGYDSLVNNVRYAVIPSDGTTMYAVIQPDFSGGTLGVNGATSSLYAIRIA